MKLRVVILGIVGKLYLFENYLQATQITLVAFSVKIVYFENYLQATQITLVVLFGGQSLNDRLVEKFNQGVLEFVLF